jgi:NADPH:quinone reductase
MRAAVLSESGIALGERPRPVPRAHQVLVQVAAAALNRADLLSIEAVNAGRAPGHGMAIGREWAGTVAEIGADVRGLRVGDRVMCSGGGGFAEYAITTPGRIYPLPDGIDFVAGAGLPVAMQTMHDAIVTHGRLARGESVLVQGASSGVGLMALQIARLMGAGLVIGTSTNPVRRERLLEFGAGLALDPTADGWVERVRDATGRRGVDVVIDQVSGLYVTDLMRAAAVRARIINVGRLGGDAGTFDFDLHALKRIEYVGVTFRTRTAAEVDEIVRRTWADLGDDVAAGRISLPVDEVFSLERIEAAFVRMAENRHFGKIVVTP